MAAYTALVSLTNLMENIQNHPRLSISLDKKQIESLEKKVDLLLDFIESCNPHGGSEEAEVLESRIASVAHAAEDVIESHIVDQIHAGSTKKSLTCLLRLEEVIEDMDSISEEVMKVKVERGLKDQQPTSSQPAVSSKPLATGKANMVGFDDYLERLLDMLTGVPSDKQIIPIAGMGGIGKTTLARNAFENSLITQFFDIRARATISQKYSVREIFLQLLPREAENSECFLALDQQQLGEKLHKHLWGRRYLIILDDIWDDEAWDNIKFSFSDNKNGSRIVVTTRLTNLALHCSSTCLEINFLDEDKSWELFCEKAFGQEGCPTELVEVGKKIAKNCKGLPLSIVVVGGFLRNSYMSKSYWKIVAKGTNSILNSEGDEQCLNILSLSYSHLPAHLKPCFLYTGVFLGDDEIRASRLIKLWVAEGFLKPRKDKSLEEIAEGYLTDLVDRNLILVRRRGSNGKIKACNVHDHLKELCLRVAQKEKFFCVMNLCGASQSMNRERRVVVPKSNPIWVSYLEFNVLRSASLARSFICKHNLSFNFRLLRVLIYAVDEVRDRGFLEADFQYVYLRCLDRQFVLYLETRLVNYRNSPPIYLPRKISLFWNLQTLSTKGCNARIVAPSEIWEMRRLRHLKVDILYLPDPPSSNRADQQDDFVLENLQTISRVENFRLSEEVCKRIINIKKLKIWYEDLPQQCEPSSYYLPHNLGRLQKLESLNLEFTERPYWRRFLLNIIFPNSLQKLCLYGCRLYWNDLIMFGLLPNLEVLKLEYDSVIGPEWKPIEGNIPSPEILENLRLLSSGPLECRSFPFPGPREPCSSIFEQIE